MKKIFILIFVLLFVSSSAFAELDDFDVAETAGKSKARLSSGNRSCQKSEHLRKLSDICTQIPRCAPHTGNASIGV